MRCRPPLAGARSLIAAAAIAQFLAGYVEAASLEDASADKVVASTVVPDPARKVGEVRLVERGDAVVAQTLLSTKLLDRVVAEIGKKEERNWPDAPADSASASATPSGKHQYLAALDAARTRLDARDTGPDRRHQMLIEFVADAHDAAVLVGTFASAASEPGHLDPRDREIFQKLEVPRPYVLAEIRLILADSFDMQEKDVDRLGPLGPAAKHGDGAPRSGSSAAPGPGPQGSAPPPPAGANAIVPSPPAGEGAKVPAH